MVEDFLGLALGLVVLGILAYLLSGSFLPLLVVAVVIWSVWHFVRGFSGHDKH